MDAQTEELRHAHDVLADWYAERLAGVLESMPIERAVLDLFSELRGRKRSNSDYPGAWPDSNGAAIPWVQ